jgi:hypothetical protein
MNPIQWWVQLVDSSPLENHDELRTACRWFTGAEHFRYEWDMSSTIPTAIAAQGSGAPPDVHALLKSVQHLIGRNEYMIFIVMVEVDTLDPKGVFHVAVTKNTLTQVETGKELLAKAKEVLLDVDEELSAESLDTTYSEFHNPCQPTKGAPADAPRSERTSE